MQCQQNKADLITLIFLFLLTLVWILLLIAEKSITKTAMECQSEDEHKVK
jgi:hypothetical protein